MRTVYKARLKSIRSLTPSQRELHVLIEDPQNFSFQSGQFVMLHVPVATQEKPVLRAYSLASDDHVKNEFKLIIKLLPEGIGVASEYLRTLRGGEQLNFTGPFGKLLFKTPPPPQVLLFCTGAGLSQHMSFLLSHANQYPRTKYEMLIGVWNEEEILCKAELENIQRAVPSFNFQFVVDKASDSWTGLRGYITQYFDRYNLEDTHIYLCGNPEMIKSAKAILEQKSFPKDKLFSEAFY